MKKIYLILICLLGSVSSFSQYYNFQYDVYFNLDQCSEDNRYYLDYMRYTTANNTVGDVTDFNMYRQRDDKYVANSIHIPATSGPIIDIIISTARQRHNTFPAGWNTKCGSDVASIYSNPAKDNCFNLNKINWHCLEDCSTISVNTFKCYPVLTDALIKPADNAFPIDDPIDIVSSFKGFPASVYHWEFSLDLNNWYALPGQYQGKDAINLNAAQLFAGSGFDANNYIEKKVWMRLNTCAGDAVSNPITYMIKKSPPKITAISLTQPTCFDSNDGKATFTFDRALLAGETMVLDLKDLANSGLFYYHQISNTDLDNAHAYTFPDNLQPSEYQLTYNGKYVFKDGNEVTQTSQSNVKQSDVFKIVAPAPVSFTTTQINVWCYGGNDGTITISALGGVGGYQYMIKRSGQPDSVWYPFTNTSQQIIIGLSAAIWLLQVRDNNQCYAKSGAGGTIIASNIIITQPANPLQNNLVSLINPTGYGLADGSIEVNVTGGTAKPDGSYNFQWRTLSGVPINTGISASVINGAYNIKLSNLPDGTYILATNDYNYAYASASGGCVAVDTFTITQPTALLVNIVILDSILCNGNLNGSLVAHAKGGIKFNNGNPYNYTWSKQNSSGVYEVMSSQTDSIATALVTGWYSVNIKDANGIVLSKDSTFYLPEPTVLQVSVSQVNVTCSGLPDGSAIANPTGGTVPYNYQWNTGDITQGINNIPTGTYLVYIKDYHNCPIQQNIIVVQPNAMALTFIEQQPLCNNYCDGKLTAILTGGTTPFTYQWQGSSSLTNEASNLCSGNYGVSIIDAMGCSINAKDTLINPLPLPISLGADRYICSGQSILYDITIPSSTSINYQWKSTNSFISSLPNVTLTQAGTYYATVKDANGCNNSDTVILSASNTVISNEFALPTQAFVNEQIIVVNTSVPAGDSIKWIIPAQAIISQQTDQFAAFTFADTGVYFIKLITYKGLCFAEQTKKIIVSARTDLNGIGTVTNPFIKLFKVAPNPNNGNFIVSVTLQDKASIQLKLINVVTSQAVSLARQNGSDSYVLPVSVSLVAGTYILLLETPKGSATMRLVIF